MIPNGKEMTWKGHHLVFEAEPNPCRGCFFADKDECPDCDEGAWVEDAESVTVDMSGISMEKLNRISTSTRRKNVEIIHK